MSDRLTADSIAATLPTLVVVGHPNKGKSSIVATLTERADIAIDAVPGTTQTADAYDVEAQGRVLYRLADTPGFERPRASLQWLTEHADTAADRARVVGDFVEAFANTPGDDRFNHECELLRPILDGAGILYVVDGSVPYGAEYEAEMEVLRWTARPRMALINPIGEANHIEAWRAPLRQYFDVVQVFDTMSAAFEKRVAILDAFAQLHEPWREPLQAAAATLREQREEQRHQAAQAIATMLVTMLSHTATRKLGHDADMDKARKDLVEKYRDEMRRHERRGRSQVEAIYRHLDLDRREAQMDLLDVDLFSTSHWSVFGLSRNQLASMGAAGGAIAGGMFDAGVGGASFLAGTALGGLAGGAGAFWGANRLEKVRVLSMPLGGKQLKCGPVRSGNFAFVLLGRAVLHYRLVAGRSHASRLPLEVGQDGETVLKALTASDRKALGRLFSRAAKPAGLSPVDGELAETIEPMLRDEK
jgi:signal recognition particle receptor subunit beta